MIADPRPETAPEIAAAARLIDRLAGPLCKARVEADGDEGSGAGTMYAERFRAGRVISIYEPPLVTALMRWKECPRRLIEVGGGIGGAAILAAAMGFEATCFDCEAKRAALGEAIVASLADAFPGITERIRFVTFFYPPAQPVERRDTLIFATNIVATVGDEVRRELIGAFNAFEWFVIDVDRFVTKAETQEERARTIAGFTAAGARGEPFLEVGRQACFWRFEGGTHIAARRVAMAQLAAGGTPGITPELIELYQDARQAVPAATRLGDAHSQDGSLALLAATCGMEACWMPPAHSGGGTFDQAAAALASLAGAQARATRCAGGEPAAAKDRLCIEGPGDTVAAAEGWSWLQPTDLAAERQLIELWEARGRPAVPLPAAAGRRNPLLLAPTDWAASLPGRHMSGDDVIASLTRLACSVTLERRRVLGDESRVTGFYLSRAQQGSLLQHAEIAVADLVGGWPSSPDRPLVEIGCGIGILSILLATRGHHAIGIDHSAGRIAIARALTVRACAAGLPIAPVPRFEEDIFPAWARKAGLRGGVALVTNLLGKMEPRRQRTFIAALSAFDRVVIDLQRFYTRRETEAEQAELVGWLRHAGFVRTSAEVDLGPDGRLVVFDRRRSLLKAMIARVRGTAAVAEAPRSREARS